MFSISPLRRSGAGFCFPSLAGARRRADGKGAGRTATLHLQPTEKLCRRITAQAFRLLIVVLETFFLSKKEPEKSGSFLISTEWILIMFVLFETCPHESSINKVFLRFRCGTVTFAAKIKLSGAQGGRRGARIASDALRFDGSPFETRSRRARNRCRRTAVGFDYFSASFLTIPSQFLSQSFFLPFVPV